MARWSDYTTGERIKILRGSGMTQEGLAEASGLSVAMIRKAERDLGAWGCRRCCASPRSAR